MLWSSGISSSDVKLKVMIDDAKISTVVPANTRTEEELTYELRNMDLIMKMHYITTVHFFEREAVTGLSISELKYPMFVWLDLYYPICGRIRRSSDDHDVGRPYVKCNDSGVRIVEAKCAKTLDQWRTEIGDDHQHLLAYTQPLSHDDSPFMFLQFTEFSCGGICVGMSWPHVLGDAFSAFKCISMWANLITNIPKQPRYQLVNNDDEYNNNNNGIHDSSTSFPRSIKLLESHGNNWFIPNNCKMQTHTFHLTEKLLSEYMAQYAGENIITSDYKSVKSFEVISAVIWKSLAKVLRGIDAEAPKIVTLCHKKQSDHKSRGDDVLLGNANQAIGVVEAEMVSVDEADAFDLAKWMVENFVDETKLIEKVMKEGKGNLDFMVYGANLTFVNLEEVNLYGMEVQGHEPVVANLSIGGVGDGGAVVVLPDDGGGRIVNVTLPEVQLKGLKNELGAEWGTF